LSSVRASAEPEAVLFDLDGTLLDTAPDMIRALNEICAEEHTHSVTYERARCFVSNGAVGLLQLAFPNFDPLQNPALHRRYLERYAENLALETRLFPHFDSLLSMLEQAAVPWGVVTNKPGHLTEPLMAAMGLGVRSACTVSGDTLPERKPHPRPILFALERIGADPSRSIYVGDARRDIEAGRAAGTTTVAALYGYVEPGQNPADWEADHVVGSPLDLIALLKRRL
jgi:N-acetyl-D-muramate 6-phosphate phosphatase